MLVYKDYLFNFLRLICILYEDDHRRWNRRWAQSALRPSYTHTQTHTYISATDFFVLYFFIQNEYADKKVKWKTTKHCF